MTEIITYSESESESESERGLLAGIGTEGEVLVIHNVSRMCDDVYECFVDNGVAPAVSKAIRVTVDCESWVGGWWGGWWVGVGGVLRKLLKSSASHLAPW